MADYMLTRGIPAVIGQPFTPSLGQVQQTRRRTAFTRCLFVQLYHTSIRMHVCPAYTVSSHYVCRVN